MAGFSRTCFALLLAGCAVELTLQAHPMPNSVIQLALRDDGVMLDVAVPIPELRLALAGQWPNTAGTPDGAQRSAVEAYFQSHCAVLSRAGMRQPLVVQAVSVWQANDENVGNYQELRLRLFAPVQDGFDPRDFVLAYDAVIHQIPNHFALVEITQDFRAGVLSGDAGASVGVIRYDFKRNATPPLLVKAAPGSAWQGFRSVIGLGFRHVTTGIDHVLFLLTLLVVAPLAAQGGSWSLFQGWSYTLRRFLTISIAFTLGHSLALLAGVYAGVPVPRYAVEILIAASILLAAIHAIHPLFTGREWMVAAGFGTIHGLAFSESLVGLSVAPLMKAVAVSGFNIGVEGAQLVVMACALPLLAVSRWRVFHSIRVVTMVSTAVLASVWVFERAM